MALNNPDLLFPILEDLSQKLRHFNHLISYALDDAEHIVHVSADQTAQASFDTHHAANTKEEDNNKIIYWENETNSMLNKVNILQQNILDVHTKLVSIRSACNQSLDYWTGELSKARIWLNSAKNRLATATTNLNIAINNLQSAQASLSSAQSALSSCQNSYRTDKDGRRIYNDCSSYAAQVANAQQRVYRAQADCNYWQQEKREAEIEVAKAEARVRRCDDGVSLTQQAITINNLNFNIVQEADNFCKRSQEEIKSAQDIMVRARQKNVQQDELVQQNRTNLNAAQSFSDEARGYFIEANKISNQVQIYGNLAGEEINRKIDLLKEFSAMPDGI